jgi:hypothetical protein
MGIAAVECGGVAYGVVARGSGAPPAIGTSFDVVHGGDGEY